MEHNLDEKGEEVWVGVGGGGNGVFGVNNMDLSDVWASLVVADELFERDGALERVDEDGVTRAADDGVGRGGRQSGEGHGGGPRREVPLTQECVKVCIGLRSAGPKR